MLPVHPVPDFHCGTRATGWLSGWNSSIGDPVSSYNETGEYPSLAQEVANATVCFVDGGRGTCALHVTIGVVKCENFFLWRLPYTAGCDVGYCTIELKQE